MKSILIFRSAFLVILSVHAVAQSTLPLSSTRTTPAIEGAGLLPGCGTDFRLQILISAARLQPLAGRTLTELHFRRSLGFQPALSAGTADLEVDVSPARSRVTNPSATFSDNHGPAPVAVFRSQLTIPASPAVVKPVIDPWQPQNLLRIVFSQGYPYQGGDLCIEIRGRPGTGSGSLFWPIDHEAQVSGGSAVEYGSHCATWTNSKVTAYGSAESLRIGGTTWLHAIGRVGATPIMLLGVRKIDPGFDLAPLGAPGCKQLVAPILMVPVSYLPPPAPSIPGIVALPIKLSDDPTLMGQSFVVQFAEDERALPRSSWTNAAALSTTNAVAMTVSALPPNLGIAVVRSETAAYGKSPLPGWGQVDVTSAPEMRLAYR